MARKPRPFAGVMFLALLACCGGCRSLGREVNEALPEFLRFDPGKEELERYRRRIQVMNRTEEEKAAAEASWQKAKAYYDDGEWYDAAQALQDFLEAFPDTPHDKEARFLLVRAQRNRNKADDALRAIKSFVANYPISEYNDEIEREMHQLAVEYIEGKHDFFIFGSKKKGVDLLELMVLNFPAGKLADEAQWELGNYQMREENWIEAGEAFEKFVDRRPADQLASPSNVGDPDRFADPDLAARYPYSKWTARATYNRALCRLATVKGADYDEVTIVSTMQDFRNYLDRFPEGDRREEAEGHIAFLREMHGDKQLRIARWYRGQGFDQSARFYLLKTIENHPDTAAAVKAEKLLAEIPADYEDPFEDAPEPPADLPEESPEAEAPTEESAAAGTPGS